MSVTEDITKLNGKTSEQQAREVLEQAQHINLNEVAPEPVEVTLHEYVEDPETHRRKLVTTQHTIETHVPMRLFNRMIATQKRVREARTTWLANNGKEEPEPEDDPSLVWQTQQVLAIWKLTEPEMTLERLQEGLDITQVEGLFTRFFARSLNLLNPKSEQ